MECKTVFVNVEVVLVLLYHTAGSSICVLSAVLADVS